MEEQFYNIPQKGMGVTVCYWRAREPATIIKVKGKILMIRLDSLYQQATNLHSHIIINNPSGLTMTFSKRKSNKWIMKGESDSPKSTYLVLGERAKVLNDGVLLAAD
jgi:hypothetical protein